MSARHWLVVSNIAWKKLRFILSVKSDFLHSFFQAAVVSMHYVDANKTAGEIARRQLHKNAASNIEHVLEATPHKAPTIRPPTSHHENYPS